LPIGSFLLLEIFIDVWFFFCQWFLKRIKSYHCGRTFQIKEEMSWRKTHFGHKALIKCGSCNRSMFVILILYISIHAHGVFPLRCMSSAGYQSQEGIWVTN
jgi:hypothetical protein